MRGVYGHARERAMANPSTVAIVGSSVSDADAGQLEEARRRTLSMPSPSKIWEQVKVGVVLTLSAVAVLVAGKVLSTKTSRRRSY